MPTQHVIAMLKAAKPADAAGTLLGIPPDRQAILFAEIPPTDLARILAAAQPAHRAALLTIMPPDRRGVVIGHLSRAQLLDVLAVIPPPLASTVLLGVPPRTAAELYEELPEDAAVRMREFVRQDQPVEFWAALYLRRAVAFVASTAAGVSWLDERTGDLIVPVFGKTIQVGIRFRSGAPFTALDVDHAAHAADWGRIAGLALLTNAEVTDDAPRQADASTRVGRPVDVMRWTDQRDEGRFKRALVRLTS